eukprot:PITA_25010
MSCSKRHRAVLVPFPAQGHINPMTQLALKFVEEGFLITFVNTEYNHSRIAEANKNSFSFSNQRMIRSEVVPDGLPPTDTRTDIAKLCDVTENVIVPFLDNLIHQIKEEDNDASVCLVVDVLASRALEIAQRHHIPIAALWTSLTATYALLYNIAPLVSSDIIPSNGVPKDFKMVKYLPSMPPLCSAHLPWVSGFSGSQKEFIFHYLNRCMERVREIDWVIFNSFHHLEAPAISSVVENGGSVYPIGPLIPSALLNSNSRVELEFGMGFWAEEGECLEWLDRQSRQSVIYVSFGSLSVLSETQFQQLALGLEATERPFLWVVRSDLLQSSEAAFPPGFAERIHLSERGCLVSWCPQLRVLSHPSIACFLTHCGWNSALESITMGVPMLCWPYFADQFLNQSYIVHVWKIGFSLLKDNTISTADGTSTIDMSEIKSAVERVVTGEEGAEMKRRAMKLREIAIGAVKEGGSSYTNFRNFVNAMKTVKK